MIRPIVTHMDYVSNLTNFMSNINMNLHIFYLGYNDKQAEIKQLMTLQNVQNKNILIFDEGQISNIDLQGIEIKTITGSWAPYFIEGTVG